MAGKVKPSGDGIFQWYWSVEPDWGYTGCFDSHDEILTDIKQCLELDEIKHILGNLYPRGDEDMFLYLVRADACVPSYHIFNGANIVERAKRTKRALFVGQLIVEEFLTKNAECFLDDFPPDAEQAVGKDGTFTTLELLLGNTFSQWFGSSRSVEELENNLAEVLQAWLEDYVGFIDKQVWAMNEITVTEEIRIQRTATGFSLVN